MKTINGIRKCMKCLRTYGREFEKGKCPFCGSNSTVKFHKR